jgi:UDP-N-acetylmuramoyl-tripeptide--D-alanyl-D-alanine ligase
VLGAAAIGHYFHVNPEAINAALSEYTPNNQRSQLHKTSRNLLVLDYYNANPSSMEAAITHFAGLQGEKKYLVLGDMLELGEESVNEHLRIIELLHQKKLEKYLLVGSIFKSVKPEMACETSIEAAEILQKKYLDNYLILIKGSRGIALENVIPLL